MEWKPQNYQFMNKLQGITLIWAYVVRKLPLAFDIFMTSSKSIKAKIFLSNIKRLLLKAPEKVARGENLCT